MLSNVCAEPANLIIILNDIVLKPTSSLKMKLTNERKLSEYNCWRGRICSQEVKIIKLICI